MKVRKLALIGLVFALGFSSTLQANDFSQLGENVNFEKSINDSMSVIEKSRELRRSIAKDRSIASMSPADERWVIEFDRIMMDDKSDYLKKAYSLK